MTTNDLHPTQELRERLLPVIRELAAHGDKDDAEAISTLLDRCSALEEAAARVVELASNEGVAAGDNGRIAWGEAIRNLRALLGDKK